MSFSTFLGLLFLSIFVRNPFLNFIHLDAQHFSWLEKLAISAELTELFFPFLEMSSCMPMWMWVYSRGPPIPYPAWWIRLIFCGWSSCGCLAVFPRLKGRTNVSLFFPWWLSAGDVDYKSLHSTVYDYSWARRLTVQLFSLAVFVDSVRVHWITHLQKDLRSGLFCTSPLFLLVNN